MSLRQSSVTQAIDDLMQNVDPARFQAHLAHQLQQPQAVDRLEFGDRCPADGNCSDRYRRSCQWIVQLDDGCVIAYCLVSSALMRSVDSLHHIVGNRYRIGVYAGLSCRLGLGSLFHRRSLLMANFFPGAILVFRFGLVFTFCLRFRLSVRFAAGSFSCFVVVDA